MTGEICDALGKALRSEFGRGFVIYDEEVKQGMKTPCFFISCVESKERHYFGSRYFNENRFMIRYYPQDDNRKKRECDEIGKRLFDCLLWLKVNDELIMGRKMECKVEKGTLGFFVSYDMFVYKAEDKTPMGEISKRVVPKL